MQEQPRNYPRRDVDEFDDLGQSMASIRGNSVDGGREQWNRRDRYEYRNRNDYAIQGQASAPLLDVEPDEYGARGYVGHQSFNSFRQGVRRGPSRTVTNPRELSDTGGSKGKAMDPHVRLQISRAINGGLIEKCNGAVKQGKEAVVYHADKGTNGGSGGYDVAVKVFKRLEIRNRSEFVDGDPRFEGRSFWNADAREQVDIWCEKEFRNLVRADRGLVPVPTPLHYKENVLFMRFLGNNGWPAPQLREIDARKGHKIWDTLYTQVMEAVRR
jgi:hypothetical protein